MKVMQNYASEKKSPCELEGMGEKEHALRQSLTWCGCGPGRDDKLLHKINHSHGLNEK
jgi:hypothetical protein